MKKDVISNYIAQIINVLIRFFLIPLYLMHLGTSAFGIIGFYLSLESVMVLLDFGMGVGSSKLLAESNVKNRKFISHIIRSVESVYLLISFLLGIIIYFSSNFISSKWLTIDDASINGIEVISLMALLLAVSWPKSLYENFLIGQKKIITKNIINISINLLKVTLMIYLLSAAENKINTYFLVMIGCNLFENLCLRYLSTKNIYIDFKFAYKVNQLKDFIKYASGVGVFSILSLFVFQADKIFISANMSTSILGNYNVASVIPLAQFMLIYPITSAIFPRLVNFKKNNHKQSVIFYNDWSYILSIICITSSVFLILNFPLLIELWLGNFSKTENVLSIASLLTIGVLFHGLSSINVSMFLANGKSVTVVKIYIFSVLIYAISLFCLSSFSVLGVAFSWIFCNLSIFIFSIIYLRFFDQGLYKNYLNLIKRIFIFFLIIILGYFLNKEVFHLESIFKLGFVCILILLSVYIVFYNHLKKIISTNLNF